MSKLGQIDWENLSDDDRAYLESVNMTHMIPPDNSGVVLAHNASAEEQLAAQDAVTEQLNRNPEGYTADDYESWRVNELKDEIGERNESRSEEDQIKPEGDKKADLVEALLADDAKAAPSSE
jgi:hypothetical protein